VNYVINEFKSCGIVTVEFLNRREMNHVFLRIQESYESPYFRGKSFRIKDFKERYTEDYGEFNYYTSVQGLNFPGYTLWPFRLGYFNPLTKRERQILIDLDFITDAHYIIAYTDNDDKVCDHELAHAFYFLHKTYRDSVNRILENVDLTSIYKFMKEQDYHKDVWLDESHAWLLNQEDEMCIDTSHLSQVKVDLGRLFTKFKKKYMR